MRRLVPLVGLAVLVAACGGTSSSTDDGNEAAQNTEAGCEEAPQEVLDYLATGFVVDELGFDSGQVVKSGDHPDVWIVAGILTNADGVVGESADNEAIGIWAIRAGTWPTDYVGATSS